VANTYPKRYVMTDAQKIDYRLITG